jgi:NADPH:quinone reductase-like Zn-dependent oxidoreductase
MAGIGGAGPAGGQLVSRLGGELYAYLRSRFVAEKFVAYVAQITHADLQVLADLMQAGKVMPVIERTYPLRDTAAAVRHLETGHARGKIVVSMDAPEPER